MQGQPSNLQSKNTDKEYVEQSVVPADRSPRQIAAPKRLPPLPPAARGSTLAHKPAPPDHATQQSSKAPSQQQHKSKMPSDELQEQPCSTNTDRQVSESAIIPGTKRPQKQASQQRQQPTCKGSKTQHMVAASRSKTKTAQADRAAASAEPAQPRLQSKDRFACTASASLGTEGGRSTVASTVAEGGREVLAVAAAASAAEEEAQQASVSDRGGQTMARLTASNTALLAELVDLQVCSQFAFAWSASCLHDSWCQI